MKTKEQRINSHPIVKAAMEKAANAEIAQKAAVRELIEMGRVVEAEQLARNDYNAWVAEARIHVEASLDY